MANVNVYKQTGEKKGSVKLDDSVFGAEFNEPLVHQVITAQRNNARQGTKCSLTRTEVRGGGKKPWRQKGTGRARHGSSRSPIWTGGGVAFAPKPRDFSQKINKQQRRGALISVLSEKVAKDQFLIIDEINLKDVKTKEMSAIFEAFKLDIKTHTVTDDAGKKVQKVSKALPKILLVVGENDANVVRAAKNIPYVKTVSGALVNVYDLVVSDKCVVTLEAAKKIEEAYKD
ncbi:MAG: 50S ribosomal protein L4 [Firmicutes bacterium]|nr:50S ribosomal protein L4 [Bacillota bacterium]